MNMRAIFTAQTERRGVSTLRDAYYNVQAYWYLKDAIKNQLWMTASEPVATYQPDSSFDRAVKKVLASHTDMAGSIVDGLTEAGRFERLAGFVENLAGNFLLQSSMASHLGASLFRMDKFEDVNRVVTVMAQHDRCLLGAERGIRGYLSEVVDGLDVYDLNATPSLGEIVNFIEMIGAQIPNTRDIICSRLFDNATYQSPELTPYLMERFSGMGVARRTYLPDLSVGRVSVREVSIATADTSSVLFVQFLSKLKEADPSALKKVPEAIYIQTLHQLANKMRGGSDTAREADKTADAHTLLARIMDERFPKLYKATQEISDRGIHAFTPALN